MARAFTDVAELHLHAEHLAGVADDVVEHGRDFVRRALVDIADRMADEVPVESGETRGSITVELDGDGFGGSVGPTNRDDNGAPVGFFIEHGAGNRPPDPFVMRTSRWAAGVMPDRAAELVRDVL